MELRLINADDIEEKQRFLKILLAHYTKVPFLPSISMFTSEKKFYWAYDQEELVGITGYKVKTPSLAESIKTVVLPDFLGKGYGQRISQAIEDECQKNGIKKVISTIYAENVKMIGIKLNQGYQIEGYHPDHEAPGWHEYSLGKVLN